MNRAVFLDRDNTIIHNDADLGDPAGVRLIQGAASAIASLLGLGFRIVVISNQGGVARGNFTEADVEAVNQRIADLVRENSGGAIDRFYYCPYHPEGIVESYAREHPWRKPQPGMLLQAANDLELELEASWTIGDQERDVQAGRAAGTRTVRLHSPGSAAGPGASPDEIETEADLLAENLTEAVRLIAQQPQARRSGAAESESETGKAEGALFEDAPAPGAAASTSTGGTEAGDRSTQPKEAEAERDAPAIAEPEPDPDPAAPPGAGAPADGAPAGGETAPAPSGRSAEFNGQPTPSAVEAATKTVTEPEHAAEPGGEPDETGRELRSAVRGKPREAYRSDPEPAAERSAPAAAAAPAEPSDPAGGPAPAGRPDPEPDNPVSAGRAEESPRLAATDPSPAATDPSPAASASPAEAPESASANEPDPEADNRELLREILRELRRQRAFRDDFSVSKMLAGVVQMLAVGCVVFALLTASQSAASLLGWLLGAVLSQLVVLTLLVVHGQR